MSYYIERSNHGFNKQINLFAKEIDDVSAALGMTADEVTAIKADAAMIKYIFANSETVQNFAEEFTAYKQALRNGGNILGLMPVVPVFGPVPAAVEADVEGRFGTLLALITKKPLYTKAIGEKLGIVPSENPFVPEDGKPKIIVKFSSGGHPMLCWKKGKYQGVEIWKNTGAGYVKIDRDNNPDYIDKLPLPALGVSATWKYKMIYFYKGEIVGNWSDEVSVSVRGEV